jgi:hypothetical protein
MRHPRSVLQVSTCTQGSSLAVSLFISFDTCVFKPAMCRAVLRHRGSEVKKTLDTGKMLTTATERGTWCYARAQGGDPM